MICADSSIWGWATSGRRPDIAEKLAERLEADEIATFVPIALEVLHRPRDEAEYERLYRELLEPLHWLPFDERIARRALEVQRELASTSAGNHRRPAVDYLIAAAAEIAEANVTLWCFDRDLEVICAHTGQACETES